MAYRACYKNCPISTPFFVSVQSLVPVARFQIRRTMVADHKLSLTKQSIVGALSDKATLKQLEVNLASLATSTGSIADDFKSRSKFFKLFVDALTESSTELAADVQTARRAFTLLKGVPYPQEDSGHGFDDDDENSASQNAAKKPAAKRDVEMQQYAQAQFSKAWLQLVQLKMSKRLLVDLLPYMHENVIPHVQRPLLFADFFFACYKHGNEVSILSLRGIFVLMNEHHLGYTRFYEDLYKQLTSTIISDAEIRKVFFEHADIFLSSTHIASYLSAAFVKKISRFALHAPVDALPIMLVFIFNMLIRHPSLQIMVHCKTDDEEQLRTDPFLPEVTNPKDTHALESSLWEIQALTNHYYERAAMLAKMMHKPLPKVEMPLKPFFISSDDILASYLFDTTRNRLAISKTTDTDNFFPSNETAIDSNDSKRPVDEADENEKEIHDDAARNNGKKSKNDILAADATLELPHVRRDLNFTAANKNSSLVNKLWLS